VTGPARGARERILATATEMFQADGVHGTGINAIIARSGVAKDTLYKHFRSKDDLVVEVIRQRDAQWCRRLREGVEAATEDPKGRLLAVFALLDSELADPAYSGSVFLAASTDYPDPAHPVRLACKEHKVAVRAYLAGLARDAGHARPDILAAQLLLLLDGAICARILQDDREAGSRARQAAAVLIIKAENS
jgi:AcrR family transcriptional regulator